MNAPSFPVLAISASLSLSPCSAEITPPLSAEGAEAFATLLRTQIFDDGRPNQGGFSPATKAFRQLLKERSADYYFKDLLSHAPMAGQLYALCGIYYTDHEAFRKELPTYSRSLGTVKTMEGCFVGFNDSVSRIVKDNEDDHTIVVSDYSGKIYEVYSTLVRLRGPSESLKDWMSTHSKDKALSIRLDIASGGLCESLANTGAY